jgi:hypothetical protein
MTRLSLKYALASLILTGCAGAFPLQSNPWPAKPDPKLTSGAILNVTAAQVCVPGYASKVRNVPTAEAKRVFAAYHVPYSQRGKGELDHLISLELGGSNAPENLWPEYGPRPNPKDARENELHALVCSGQMTLADAQAAIVDWPNHH